MPVPALPGRTSPERCAENHPVIPSNMQKGSFIMETIATSNAPKAIGPYSQGIIANGFLYTSGQLGLDPGTGLLSGEDITAQAEQAMRNLQAIAAEAGGDLANTVKTLCFLSDMKDFAAFNAVYEKYFPGKPARSCVAVKQLPLDALCEVEIIVALNR